MYSPLPHLLALGSDPSRLLGSLLAVTLVTAVLGYVLLFLAALVSILRSGHFAGMKLVWIVFTLVAPFLGSLLWFLVGRPDVRRRRPA